MTGTDDRKASTPRTFVVPMVLVVLAGSLLFADRALTGTARTVTQILLVAALLSATAWWGSRVRGQTRTSDGGS